MKEIFRLKEKKRRGLANIVKPFQYIVYNGTYACNLQFYVQLETQTRKPLISKNKNRVRFRKSPQPSIET